MPRKSSVKLQILWAARLLLFRGPSAKCAAFVTSKPTLQVDGPEDFGPLSGLGAQQSAGEGGGPITQDTRGRALSNRDHARLEGGAPGEVAPMV